MTEEPGGRQRQFLPVAQPAGRGEQRADVVGGAANLEQVLEDGYRFLMPAPARTDPALERGRNLTGRSS